MSNFTKGKWLIDREGRIFCDDRYNTIIAKLITYPLTKEEDSANARLIVAAPDMYELLKEFWEKDRGIYIHSLNPERNKRYRLVRSILDRIDGKEHKNDA